MGRVCWVAGLSLCLAGCVSPGQERVRDYNEDGVHLYQRGDFGGARDSFQAALTLKADDAGLLYNLGQCHDRLGNVAKAESCYRECLQRAPNHAPCRHALTVLLVHQGKTSEAAHQIEDWMQREPKLSSPYAEDGWLWHQAGDLPRAQVRLQQALELNPNDSRALTELALVYEALQRPERALVLYERSLQQDANQPDVKRRVNFLLASGAKRPRPE